MEGYKRIEERIGVERIIRNGYLIDDTVAFAAEQEEV